MGVSIIQPLPPPPPVKIIFAPSDWNSSSFTEQIHLLELKLNLKFCYCFPSSNVINVKVLVEYDTHIYCKLQKKSYYVSMKDVHSKNAWESSIVLQFCHFLESFRAAIKHPRMIIWHSKSVLEVDQFVHISHSPASSLFSTQVGDPEWGTEGPVPG